MALARGTALRRFATAARGTTVGIREEFDEAGFVVVRGLFPRSEMPSWKREIERDAEARAASAAEYIDPSSGRQSDSDTTGVTVWMADEVPEFFRPFLFGETGRLGAVVEEIVGPCAEFLSCKPVLKRGTVAFASPWHQDWPYWRGTHKISLWIALDDCDASNACLRVVPGSHAAPLEHDGHEEAIGFDQRLSAAAAADASVDARAESVEMRAGDAIVFHDLLVHGSWPNESGADRYSLIPTYRAADAGDSSPVWASAVRMA
jgi:ectoine hydroxylase-related dioxygenase (phytanoyl-CoA dioxygenase family)